VTTLSVTRQSEKLGGVCALIIGFLNILLILYIVATSAPGRYDTGEFYRAYTQGEANVSTVNWVALVVTAVLSLAVIVPTVSNLIQSENPALVRAVTVLAIVGWAVMAISFLNLLSKVPDLASRYVNGDETTRTALVAVGLPEIDPDGWLLFGGPGIWFVVVNTLALFTLRWPRLLSWAGILVGVFFLCTIPAAILELEPLNMIAAGGGAIFSPLWHIWMGIRLLKFESLG
jgi:hypothetical protein